MNLLTPKGFLQVGGIVLVAVGILGFVLVGPSAERSIFQSAWWFNPVENWAHLVLGIVALGAAFLLTDAVSQKWITVVVGAVALLVGVVGFFLPETAPNFFGANLENPLDNILHLVVGAWALWAGLKNPAGAGTAPPVA